MKAQHVPVAICIFTLVAPVLAGVAENASLNDPGAGCRHHLARVVNHLQETATLEGIAVRIEDAETGTTLNYLDFAQHMRCVDGVLRIDVGQPVD